MAEKLILTPLETRIVLFNEIFTTPYTYTMHGHYNEAIARRLHSHLYKLWFNPEYTSLRPQDLMHDAQRSQLFSQSIDSAVNTLTSRQRTVITLHFGLDGAGMKSLKEIGRRFEVTGERVRQIEARALRTLRHPSRSRYLKEFLPE